MVPQPGPPQGADRRSMATAKRGPQQALHVAEKQKRPKQTPVDGSGAVPTQAGAFRASPHATAGAQPAAPAAMPPQAGALGAPPRAPTAPTSSGFFPDAPSTVAAQLGGVHLKLFMPTYTAAPPAAPVTASPASSDAAAAAEGVHEPPLPATNAVPAAMPVTAGAVLGPAAAAAAGRGPAKAEAVAAPVHVEVARTQGERGLLPAEGHQQVSMSNQAGVPGAPSHAPAASAGAPPAAIRGVHLELSMPAYTAAPPAAAVTTAPASSDAAAAAEAEVKPPVPAADAAPAAEPGTAPTSAAAAAVIGPAASAAAGHGPAEAKAVAATVHVEVGRVQGEDGLLPEEEFSMPTQTGAFPPEAPTAPGSTVHNAPSTDAAQQRGVHLELSMPAFNAVPPAASVATAPASSDAAAAAEGAHKPPVPAADAAPAAVPGTPPASCAAGAVIGPAASAAAGHGPAEAHAVAAPVHVEVGRVQGGRVPLPEQPPQQVSMPASEGPLPRKRPAKPNPKYAEDAP